ncbi:MAG: hypothetical protein JWN26_702 [Candidatus Saccharibacteria bacterium]|nr:hypothetical protein [Candidatus Saccharibacteria bacterium]
MAESLYVQPKRKVSKKLLIIIVSIVVIIIAAGTVVGLNIYLKPSTKQATAPTAKTDTLPDLSKDYGACSLLTKAQITSALGKIADTLQDPVNNGIVGVVLVGSSLSNFSADAQSCLYHFAPVSKSATYTNDNGLTVQLTKFGNSESTAAYQKQITTNPGAATVNGLGNSAFYTQSAAGDAQTYYTLQVFKSNALYEYTLHLPADTSTDSSTAQKALTTLAQD